jgi:hypothetical protein
MNESNLPEVARLSDKLGHPISQKNLRERFMQIILCKRHTLIVYEGTKNVIGWFLTKTEIKAFFLKDNSRDRGEGKAFWEDVEKWAKTYLLHTI